MSFSILGELGRSARTKQILAAARLYRDGEAGTNSGRAALNLAMSRLPIDPDRIYAAGHSSAGRLVLLMTATDPRIRAVAAYSPVADVMAYLDSKLVNALDRDQPGYRNFLEWSSPTSQIDQLTVPVFLFHAMDDAATIYFQTRDLYETLKETNTNVKFLDVETGGHYKPMTDVGIPAGIAWFNSLPKR